MANPIESQPQTLWQRTATRRFFVWLFSKRTLARIGFTLALFVTLIALFFAFENWRGHRAWNTFKKQMEAQGQNLEWASFIPPKVADESNFAATPFLRLIAWYPKESQAELDKAWPANFQNASIQFERVRPKDTPVNNVARKFLDLPAWEAAFIRAESKEKVLADPGNQDDPAARAKAAGAILEKLKIYAPALEELHQASSRPQCRFDLNYGIENPAMMLLPHLGNLRNICALLKLRASAKLALGQNDQAFQDAQLMLRLCEALTDEPLLISYLVQIADFRLTTDLIWEGLARHQWSDAQLQEFQRRLQKLDFLAELEMTLQAERAWGIKVIDYLQRKDPQFFWKIGEQIFEGGGNVQNSHKAEALLMKLAPNGWGYMEMANYGRMFPTPLNASKTRRIDPALCLQNQKEMQKSFDAHSPVQKFFRHEILSGILLPALSKVQTRAAEAQTVAAEAMLACALERYRLANGSYPEQLAALTPRFIEKLPSDIITGAPLIYRADGKNFVLYSVGWDAKDDGGSEAKVKTDGKSLDWVWRSQPGQ